MLALRRFARRTVDLWQLALLLIALWAGLTGGEGWLFGAVACALGLWLWHGLHPTQEPVRRSHAIGVFALLVVVVAAELAFYRPGW